MKKRTNGHKTLIVKPQRRNANLHTPRGLALLASSVDRDGWIGAVTVAADGESFDGSARIETRGDQFKDAIIVESDGTKPIIHRRTDIPNADDPRAVRLGIAANAVPAADLEWDADILAQLKDEGVELSGMFTEKELAAILPQGESKDAEPQIDKAKELQQKWQVGTGEVIQIGRHRLMCADSTNKADVDALLAGHKPDMVLTDPPYGIDEETDRVFASRTRIASGGRFAKIEGDKSTSTAVAALSLCSEIKVQVWFGANYYCHSLPESGNWLVWDKRVEENERDFNSDCELAWVRSKSSAIRIFRHLWKGLIKASEQGQARTHPTQKPVALAEFAIKEYGLKSDSLLDLFAGTGWVVVAAENLNRTCYAMEISPEYCAVVLERMTTAFPGIKIEREAISRAA